jgi:hypothetical protein
MLGLGGVDGSTVITRQDDWRHRSALSLVTARRSDTDKATFASSGAGVFFVWAFRLNSRTGAKSDRHPEGRDIGLMMSRCAKRVERGSGLLEFARSPCLRNEELGRRVNHCHSLLIINRP